MQAIKKLIYVAILLLFVGCIEEYTPKLDFEKGHLVIEGHVSDEEEVQEIRISYSDGINNTNFIPVVGCKVSVSDSKGNTYIYEEENNGIYTFTFNKLDFSPYIYFTLKVMLPDGSVYVSEKEQFLKCPPVDSVYYINDPKPSIDPEKDVTGIQIVTDYDGGYTDTRFVKMGITETWEYTVPYDIEYLYVDSAGLVLAPAAMQMYKHCWKTEKLNDFFVLSTDGLNENKLKEYPLHFVSNETNRLQYRYSMLVKQMSISENAYYYFSQLKKQITGMDGLYDTQPVALVGNIYKEGDAAKRALGYFYVGQLMSKRVFIDNRFSFRTHRFDKCYLSPITSFGDLDELSKSLFPLYVQHLPVPVDGATLGWTSKFCFDCELNGGTLERPDFWDE